MILTGTELLENLDLQNSLIRFRKRVLKVEWRDGSITDGTKKNIHLEYIESGDKNRLYLTDDFCSKEVVPSMVLTIEGLEDNTEAVYSVAKACIFWEKDIDTIYKAISSKKIKEDIDYRKVGKITLITESAMLRVFGKPTFIDVDVDVADK